MADDLTMALAERDCSDTDIHCSPFPGADDLYLEDEEVAAVKPGRLAAMFFCFPGEVYTLFEPSLGPCECGT
jgi:hypothetical protein